MSKKTLKSILSITCMLAILPCLAKPQTPTPACPDGNLLQKDFRQFSANECKPDDEIKTAYNCAQYGGYHKEYNLYVYYILAKSPEDAAKQANTRFKNATGKQGTLIPPPYGTDLYGCTYGQTLKKLPIEGGYLLYLINW